MKVLVDTRENRPYQFPDWSCVKLNVGDYTVDGLQDRIALERKTHDDLYLCLGVQRKHFLSQLARLRKIEHRALIVDTTPDLILLGHFYSGIPGGVALGRLMQLSIKYSVPVLFAGKTAGAKLAFLFLAHTSVQCGAPVYDPEPVSANAE